MLDLINKCNPINQIIIFATFAKKKKTMSAFYKLNIKEVKRETQEAVSILFNVPQELQSNYQFIAGQYINLKLTLDGKEIRRAYSICASPENNELRIAVKAIKKGTFSVFANTTLKAGDTLEVGSPEGKFTFEPQIDRQKNYARLLLEVVLLQYFQLLKVCWLANLKALLS